MIPRFKVRDTKEHVWCDAGKFYLYGGQLSVPSDTPGLFKLGDGAMGYGCYRVPDGRYEVCMSTGLKDKNGTEVYEKDIILYPWASGTYSMAIIEYRISEYNSPRWIAKTIGNDENGDEINVDIRCKIIGNRFDNPELLTEMK